MASEPVTVAEYIAACEEAINETLITVREMVDEMGAAPTAIVLRAAYTPMASVDPSRCAGMLAQTLVRLAERRPS